MPSLVAQMVKCLPTMQETQVQSLGREDLLEKEMATHSSILAWKIPWMVEPGRLQSMGSQRVGHDWATSLSLSLASQMVKNLLAMQEIWVQFLGQIPWRWEWLPTSVFLPGEFHGQRSLTGYSPWSPKELDANEWLRHIDTLGACIMNIVLSCPNSPPGLQDLPSALLGMSGFTS